MYLPCIQKYGVAMDTFLDPMLADVFISNLEKKTKQVLQKQTSSMDLLL